MDWKNKLKKGKVQYSGTCPRCGRMVKHMEICPENLPAQGKTNPLESVDITSLHYCPMKVSKE